MTMPAMLMPRPAPFICLELCNPIQLSMRPTMGMKKARMNPAIAISLLAGGATGC